jgi:hypothetical protein
VILQCRICRHRMTVAECEGIFVNPAILFGRMPYHMVMHGSNRQVRFGGCIRVVLMGLLLPLMVVGGIFLLGWCLLKGAVYSTSFLRKCQACGSRRWLWPETGPVAFP